MTDTASTLPPPVAAPRWQRVAWLLLPLVLLLAAVAWIVAADPLRSLNNGAPPVEALTYERTILDGSGIRVLVRS